MNACRYLGCKKPGGLRTAYCTDAHRLEAAALRERARRAAFRKRPARLDHCRLEGCTAPLTSNLRTFYCSSEHREEARRLRERKLGPTTDERAKKKAKVTSDAAYCEGCRFVQPCPASERKVQCLAGAYLTCAPWTGIPALKVAR